MPCHACERIDLARRGRNPWLIRELRESFVVVHDHQPYRGWCVLLLKDHAEHLHLLEPERQARLALDIADTARAIVRVVNPARINYECLGNQMAHIHWHIIPRFAAPIDPDPKMAVWVQPPEFFQRPVPDAERNELMASLRVSFDAR